jgi:hypothetical protein
VGGLFTDNSCGIDIALTVHFYFYLASEDEIRSLYRHAKFDMAKLFDKTIYVSKMFPKAKLEIINGLNLGKGANKLSKIEDINSELVKNMNNEDSFSLVYVVYCEICGEQEHKKVQTLSSFVLPESTKIDSTTQYIRRRTDSDKKCNCCGVEAKEKTTEYLQAPELLSLKLCCMGDQYKVAKNEIFLEPDISTQANVNPEHLRYSLFAVAYVLQNGCSLDHYIARIKVNDCVYTYDSTDSKGIFKKVLDTENFPNKLGELGQIFYQAHMAWYKKENYNGRYVYAMV